MAWPGRRAAAALAGLAVVASLGLTPHAAGASGSTWQIVASPNGSTRPISNNLLTGAAAISAGDVWAVGWFSGPTSGGALTEHWDGTTWSAVPNPGGELAAVAAITSGNVWAVGITPGAGANGSRTLTEHWDGTTWSHVASPNPSTQGDNLTGVTAISARDVWAVGYYLTSSQQFILPLFEHWDGATWKQVPAQTEPSNSNFLNATSAVSSTDIWADGFYYARDGSQQPLMMHFDGASWKSVTLPNLGPNGGILNAVTALSATDVWAVGTRGNGAGSMPFTLAMHWNGQKWSVIPTPNVGTLSNYLLGVTALSSHDVWAVGQYEKQDNVGTNQTLIEQWNGTTWSVVPSPNQGTVPGESNTLFAATRVSPNTVWAVGTWNILQRGNPGERTLIEQTTQG